MKAYEALFSSINASFNESFMENFKYKLLSEIDESDYSHKIKTPQNFLKTLEDFDCFNDKNYLLQEVFENGTPYYRAYLSISLKNHPSIEEAINDSTINTFSIINSADYLIVQIRPNEYSKTPRKFKFKELRLPNHSFDRSKINETYYDAISWMNNDWTVFTLGNNSEQEIFTLSYPLKKKYSKERISIIIYKKRRF